MPIGIDCDSIILWNNKLQPTKLLSSHDVTEAVTERSLEYATDELMSSVDECIR